MCEPAYAFAFSPADNLYLLTRDALRNLWILRRSAESRAEAVGVPVMPWEDDAAHGDAIRRIEQLEAQEREVLLEEAGAKVSQHTGSNTGDPATR